MWRHRAGLDFFGKTVIEDNRIPGLILDTFDNLKLEGRDGRKVKVKAKKKTSYGWYMCFELVPGVSWQKVKRAEQYFCSATKAWVVITWDGQYLHMEIQCSTLPTNLPYEWDPSPYLKTMDLPVLAGISQRGPEVFPLESAPHLLVAGIPGFGKSNFLHTLINGLLPLARICIIDLKRLEFSYLKDRVLLAKTEEDAIELLRDLNREHDKRVTTLEKAGCVKVQDYNKKYPDKQLQYIVTVIDEVAEIQDERTHDLRNRLERLARATGISIVSATQRPSVKVINGDSRAQYSARLCFLVADEVNSRMVLGEECPHAAYLPADHKGRAIFKFGQTLKEVQTMFLPISKAKELVKESEVRSWDIEHTKRLNPR